MDIDYNGTGRWSSDELLKRYDLYVQRFGISHRLTSSPVVHSAEGKRWTYPVMRKVIEGIEKGDLACAQIGVEFIEESASFPFGRILKSNTARALRRAPLTSRSRKKESGAES